MDEFVRAVEAAVFASAEPLGAAEIAAYAGEGDVAAALAELAERYQGHGIELVERGGRWHFQTAPDLAHLLRRTREEPRRLSRAATETLAIVAYHEPVSRADIEAIRGVQISKGTLDVLMEAGWVKTAGRREVPGRPLLYATTPEFLTHFGLGSRKDLPGIDDLKAAGLLDPLEDAIFQLDLDSESEERLESQEEAD
ncbi:SMC-Scp complex subunit ScpB [Sphingomonas sp. RG327]|jgi:segregation and condensation protein B|uniref:SMC-Scp complex subunit ScpB n=1 Tax=Sphingomonas anseongensis TaxID=2908207 RepID=A0ABT0RF33_9SPHN|nr:SMC-Scp complex subunit ScpB [Sphingomonas anseongensis]MCL6678834.1 SMC-Scp complex subunit ScpB [Sphingomonas anseongensis]